MALDYQLIPFKSFGGGQDSYSAPSSIQAPYLSQLLNMDVQASGLAQTRKGYEGYYGYIPLRVSEIEHSGTSIKLRIGTPVEIDFGLTPASPILVYGKLSSAQTGDFSTTDALVYYSQFTVDNKFAISAPSGTISVTTDDTGVTSDDLLVRTAVATASGTSYTSYLPDSLTIDSADFTMSIGYTTPTDESSYVWWKQTDVTAGSTYKYSATAETTISITAATHALDNYNIQVECYDTSSGDKVKVIPDSVTISQTGTVGVTFSAAFTGDILLNATNDVAVMTAVAGTNTLTISSPESPWIIASVYYWDASSSSFVEVIPDTIDYDSTADEITIDYTLASGAESVEVYYSFGLTRGNLLSIVDSGAVSTTYTDSSPQLTVWGIPHSEIYRSTATEGGHVTHIDTYRRTGESRVVCGLGGNLFSAQSREEAGTTYGMPSLYAFLRTRVDGDIDLSPLFHTTGSTGTRTRGLVLDDSITSNKAKVTAATFVSSGVVDYTLSFTGKTGDIILNTQVSTSDYLTISGMANKQHNGSWKISSIQSDSSTETVIRVENSSVWGADLDETAANGGGGVFTDLITTTAATNFISGDEVISPAISTDLTLLVSSVSSTSLYISGVTEDIATPDGQIISIKRTTDVIPLRDSLNAASTTNYVRGDMLSISGFTRKFRVKYVNPNSDISITDLSGDGTTATATMGSAHGLTPGQKVLISRAGGDLGGVKTILTVPTTTTFTYSSTSEETGATGTLVGETIEIDESIEIQDSSVGATTFSVVGRWAPIEIPSTDFDMPDDTQVQQFDSGSYTEQPYLRSTTIADSLYLTSGDDEVFKFDGSNLYRAGLFRWQPELFCQVDTTTGSITTDTTAVLTITPKTVSGKKFRVTLGEEKILSVGQRIQDAADSAIYTVVSLSDDGTHGFVYVNEIISDTSDSARNLTPVSEFNYYFRANAIDANNSVVASAVTGLSDFVVDLAAAAQIKMKLLGRPNFGPYDFDRIELEIYRTKQGTSAPFYKVATLTDSFDAGSRYIEFTDGTPDEILRDFDSVNTALLGAEVGTAWDQPLRAKYLTSADNRLVTANLKDYPQLDIVFRKKSSAVTLAASDLDGKKFTFRDDNTAAAGTGFEFVDNSGAVTIDPATDLSATTSAFTVASTAHGLVVGDWVYLYHAAEGTVNHLTYAGWWQIASKTTDTFTISLTGSATISDAANHVNRYITATAPADVPVFIGTDGNYNQIGGNTTGSYEFLAPLRLANAINAFMTTTSSPWATAAAGSLYGLGRIVLRQPEVRSTTMELVMPTMASTENFQIYVNNLLRDSEEQVSASTRLYPSRVAISFPNYPEIMDGPQAENPSTTRSVVDINAADGSEVTGIISFFGDSSFGDSQKEGIVVVGKSDAIYVLNINTRQYEKVDSSVGGHTAPFAMTHTDQGVIFTNKSGIYRLNADLTVTWISKYADRIWKKELNRDQISKVTAHNFKDGKQIRISYPSGSGQLTNNKVLVFDYSDPRGRQDGIALGVYDNFPATGWCSLEDESFFGTTDGQVFRTRNANDSTDYRDDASAINQTLISASENFDLPGFMKIVDGLFIQFFNDSASVEGITVSTAMDNKTTFTASDSLANTDTDKAESGYWFSIADRKGRAIQVKVTNSTKDQFMAIAGMAVRAAALGRRGSKQASD